MITPASLRHIPMLRGMDERALSALAGVLVLREFDDSQAIMRQGQPADGIYLLLRGHVRVTRQLPGDSTVGLVTMGPGALFGALAALDGRSRAADCIAWGRVQTGFLSLADFSALMEGDTPSALRFQVAVLRTLFSDIRNTNQRLAELATLPEMDLSSVGDIITGLA
ncbi:MAG: CRP/FNR family cyclic AMP-dependent transcriptional regulator [Myxococcota bacterium]|jgi:CRP/FNR family cyclic AMP-dependent transcriptional regulator